MERVIKWDGELLLAQGWAHYRGPAGDTSFHAHYPVQLVYAGEGEASVRFEDRVVTGHLLSVPSNVPHKLLPSEGVLDLLYIEPSLTAGMVTETHPLKQWLAKLKEGKACIGDPRMMQAHEAIDDNLMGKVTQDAIARAAGMSKSSFTKLFRASVGMPLRRYVLWRRLNIAVAAIGEGSDATTAAHKAGFADSAHFSRTMRQTFGVSPAEGVLKIKMTIVAPVIPSVLQS